jgi:RNA polymerase sigma factor (sigma-70 family)
MMEATRQLAHENSTVAPVAPVIDPAQQKERMREYLARIGSDRDEQAFAEIYKYFAGRVKSFLIGKGMNEDSAEELMQEIMLIIWRRAESYDRTKAAASTWIFTIARNRHIDFLRGNNRIEVELDDEILELETTERDVQEKHVDDEHAANRLARALEKLPLEQRQVMHLSYFRGQSHGAIARWLDLPIGTVKSRIRLAMQAVRTQLLAEDFEH